MTREEQIQKAAERYMKGIVTPLPASLMTAFIKGAEYADQHPINYDGKAMLHVLNKGVEQGYKDAVEKALEWWKEDLTYPSMCAEEIAWIDAKIEDFKKYMEEQQ